MFDLSQAGKFWNGFDKLEQVSETQLILDCKRHNKGSCAFFFDDVIMESCSN
jgi:hypothetical protein